MVVEGSVSVRRVVGAGVVLELGVEVTRRVVVVVVGEQDCGQSSPHMLPTMKCGGSPGTKKLMFPEQLPTVSRRRKQFVTCPPEAVESTLSRMSWQLSLRQLA